VGHHPDEEVSKSIDITSKPKKDTVDTCISIPHQLAPGKGLFGKRKWFLPQLHSTSNDLCMVDWW